MTPTMIGHVFSRARTGAAVSLVAILALSTAALGAPSDTAAGTPLRLAQATPPAPPSGAAPTKPRRSMADRVESRIKSLHDHLKITSAQEPQWNAVAQVMRENA